MPQAALVDDLLNLAKQYRQAYYGRAATAQTLDQLIPDPIDQNPWAHWRSPMDMMRQG
jgi:hypothetical protein